MVVSVQIAIGENEETYAIWEPDCAPCIDKYWIAKVPDYDPPIAAFNDDAEGSAEDHCVTWIRNKLIEVNDQYWDEKQLDAIKAMLLALSTQI